MGLIFVMNKTYICTYCPHEVVNMIVNVVNIFVAVTVPLWHLLGHRCPFYLLVIASLAFLFLEWKKKMDLDSKRWFAYFKDVSESTARISKLESRISEDHTLLKHLVLQKIEILRFLVASVPLSVRPSVADCSEYATYGDRPCFW